MAAKKTTHTTKTTKTAKTTQAAAPATPAPAPPAPNSPVLLQGSSTITAVANDSNAGSKVELQTSYQAFIVGLMAYYQPTDTFDLPTGLLTRDEVIAEFQRFITAAENTKASNQAWRANVQVERAVELEVAPIKRGVRNIVTGKFSANGAELLQFGVEPRKPTKKTAESKALAAVKAKATRDARGTKGSQQKKDIHCTVPAAPAATAPADASAASIAAPAAVAPKS
jgi:hypothetical protein